MNDIYAIEAEQAVLGAFFEEPALIYETKLLPEHFSPGRHHNLFYTMKDLAAKDIPIDPVVIVKRVAKPERIEAIGGITYMTELAAAVPTVQNFKFYESAILDSWQRRKIGNLSTEIAREIIEYETAAEAIDDLKSKIAAIELASSDDDDGDIKEDIMQAYENIEQNAYRASKGEDAVVSGTPTGYRDLDKITNGLQKQDLVIIGARPSMGKTAFALNIANNIAADYKAIVPVFSLEMAGWQLVNRMFCSIGNIDAQRLRTGYLASEDWSSLTVAMGQLSNSGIKIYKKAGQSLAYISSKLRKLRNEHPDKPIIAVIDYLQLIVTPGSKGNNRNNEIGAISRGLKQLARSLDITVVALSQLSRGVEQRQDKRPMLSDLRESGEIEQDADVIGFLYRDDYYDKNSEKTNIVEVIIAKQRNGPTGTAELAFVKEYNKFVNLDHRYTDE